MSALDTQPGGSHYKHMKIQPVVFIHANKLGFLEGCIIKRICRWRLKDGIKDLEKIKHEVDLLIELHQQEMKAREYAVQQAAMVTGASNPVDYNVTLDGC